jgi:hypothetical protein
MSDVLLHIIANSLHTVLSILFGVNHIANQMTEPMQMQADSHLEHSPEYIPNENLGNLCEIRLPNLPAKANVAVDGRPIRRDHGKESRFKILVEPGLRLIEITQPGFFPYSFSVESKPQMTISIPPIVFEQSTNAR